jgi:hypothetical protein
MSCVFSLHWPFRHFSPRRGTPAPRIPTLLAGCFWAEPGAIAVPDYADLRNGFLDDLVEVLLNVASCFLAEVAAAEVAEAA